MPPKAPHIRLRRGLVGNKQVPSAAVEKEERNGSHPLEKEHCPRSPTTAAAAAATPLAVGNGGPSPTERRQPTQAVSNSTGGDCNGILLRGPQQRRNSRLQPLPALATAAPKGGPPLQPTTPPPPLRPVTLAPTGKSYMRPMMARQFATAAAGGAQKQPQQRRESEESPPVSLSSQPPQRRKDAPPLPAPVLSLQELTPSSPLPPVGQPLCSEEAFLRGIDLMNAALRASSHGGGKSEAKKAKKGQLLHAVAFSGGGGKNLENCDDSDNDGSNDGKSGNVGLTFQALVATSSSRQRTLRTVDMLPLWLISDGVGLLVVDFNGTQKHQNYQSIQSLLPSVPDVTLGSADAATPGAQLYWLDWGTLAVRASSQTSGNGGKKEEEELVVALAESLAALPVPPATGCGSGPRASEDCAPVSGAAAALPAPAQALKSVSFDYAGDPLVLYFPHPTQAVREALEDIAQAYLPAFLQHAYPRGVPVEGRWSRQGKSTALWQAAGATASGPALPPTPAKGLTALYPALHFAHAAAKAQAVHGALHLPAVLWQALHHQRANYSSAFPAAPRAVAATNTTGLSGPSSVSSIHKPFEGPGKRLGRAAAEQHGTNGSPANGTREPLSPSAADRRLAWLTAAAPKDVVGPQRQQREQRPQDNNDPPAKAKATDAAVPSSSSCELLYTAPLCATGAVPARAPAAKGSRAGATLCRQVTLLTPLGRLLLERGGGGNGNNKNGNEQQLAGPATTIEDVKNAALHSALGRRVGLVAGGFSLVYAPGTPALKDDVILDVAAATLRVVRHV